ncbi:NUDIX domain-containing protein [Pantoea sp. At-9b]|uniref:NUDIX domain-containing protein n=1 Tax=Pantoea sp. (strain At-9b) TaxID=592316 RepID=UPI0001B3EE8F|nr:NUDIX domain-containing protein [Pantoea sp. At-9b]ADU69659.1 NUDIX hydrolase [Pantoea sp. At-9b]
MNHVENMPGLVGHRLLLLAGARILLQLRKDGSWGLPGGWLAPGESPEQTVRREAKEETNLDVHRIQLLGYFSGPEYTFSQIHTEEADVVTALYQVDEWSGVMIHDPSQSDELTFFSSEELPRNMAEEYRQYIHGYLAQQK